MPRRDLFKSSLDAGREATQAAQDRLESLLTSFQQTAEEQVEQVQSLANEVVEQGRRQSERFLEVVDREIRAQVANVGIATKADIRRLEKKIESMQGRATASATPAKKAPVSATPAKKAPVSATPAKKAAVKKAAVKKAAVKKAAKKRS